MTQSVPFHQFSLHQVYMTNPDIPLKTSSQYNVQPTSHTSKHRMLPSLPYTTDNLNFINKFNFQFTDLTDAENFTLCNLLHNKKTCLQHIKMMLAKLQLPFVSD